jgi:hypothetical protein
MNPQYYMLQQRSPGSIKPQQFSLDTTRLFVLKAGFEPVWLIGVPHTPKSEVGCKHSTALVEARRAPTPA